jgi:hypothetical protein
VKNILKINGKERNHMEDLGVDVRAGRKSTFQLMKEVGSEA